MDHPPHSPDLTPSDFYLFDPLKQYLSAMKLDSDEKIKEHVEKFFQKSVQFFEEKMGKMNPNGDDFDEK